jgi:carbonic anhydrase
MASTLIHSRRSFLRFATVAGASAALASCGASIGTTSPTVLTSDAPVSSPDEALGRLLDGNKRYMENHSTLLNESVDRRVALVKGQNPFATVFSCVDSRVPPELVFDRGLGDLFVIRTAGHVVDGAVLGSLEFGAAELKIPLLLVMGHQKCGAVAATIETVESNGHAPGDIAQLVAGITPAVEESKGQAGDHVQNAVLANVAHTVAELRVASLLGEAISAGKLKIVGGWYSLETGKVELTVL